MIVSWTSELGDDEKWLDFLYVKILDRVPFDNN